MADAESFWWLALLGPIWAELRTGAVRRLAGWICSLAGRAACVLWRRFKPQRPDEMPRPFGWESTQLVDEDKVGERTERRQDEAA